jgi:hypothetical protein
MSRQDRTGPSGGDRKEDREQGAAEPKDSGDGMPGHRIPSPEGGEENQPPESGKVG